MIPEKINETMASLPRFLLVSLSEVLTLFTDDQENVFERDEDDQQ